MKGNQLLVTSSQAGNHGAPTSECIHFSQESRESNVEAEEARGEGKTWIKSGKGNQTTRRARVTQVLKEERQDPQLQTVVLTTLLTFFG